MQANTPAAIRMRELRAKRHSLVNGNPEFRHPELILGFIPQKFCILCGEGIERIIRRCHLHPDICDTCEDEYCEHGVNLQEPLTTLEEVADLPEEQRVPVLLARRIALRVAGKHRSHPIIRKPEATGYIHIRRRHGPDDDNPSNDNTRKIMEED